MTKTITDIPAEAPYDANDDSLYARLGGLYGISAAVDNLVDRLYVNPGSRWPGDLSGP